MKKMLDITDKILQINLFSSMTAFAADKLGLINLVNITNTMNQENIVHTALTISAVTGAIYGIYKTCVVLDKLVSWIRKIIKK